MPRATPSRTRELVVMVLLCFLTDAQTPAPSLPLCTFSQMASCALQRFPSSVINCLSSDPATRAASCNYTMYCDLPSWIVVKACFATVPCYGLTYDGMDCWTLFSGCPTPSTMTDTLCVGALTNAPAPPTPAPPQPPSSPTPAPTYDPRSILLDLYTNTVGSRWTRSTGWNTSSSFCSWYGVSCSSGQVVGLALSRNGLSGALPNSLGNLASLKALDLSENFISGSISMLARLTGLTQLILGERVLTTVCVFPYQGPGMEDCLGWPDGGQMEGSYQPLSVNDFSGDGSAVFGLPNVQRLTLHSPQLELHLDDTICGMKDLEYTMMRYLPFMTGSIPDCLPGNLTKLRVFHLTDASITGTVPASIASMPELVQLGLSFNQLSGPLPGFAPKMMHYFLNGNNFEGPLPPAQPYSSPDGVIISNLMESILFYSNQVNGTLPASYGQMKNLKYVWGSNNQLTGTIPATWSNLTLLMVALDRNELSGTVPGFVADWSLQYTFAMVPPPYCQTCTYGSLIPASTFPVLMSLVILRLGTNNFTGTIPAKLLDMPMLTDIEFSKNQISGRIEDYLRGSAPLENVALQHNMIEGSLDNSSVCRLTTLHSLDVSFNLIEGSIPNCIGKLTGIVQAHFSHNKISGTLPPAMGNLSQLAIIDLSQNQISGSIPSSFSNMVALRDFSIGYNSIQGETYTNLIPFALLPALTSLNFEHNFLDRDINFFLLVAVGSNDHFAACKSWNLAHNRIVGTLPIAFDQFAVQMTYLNVEGNDIEGEIPAFPSMDVLLLKDNPKMKSATNSLPAFLNTTSFFLRGEGTYVCPMLTGTDRELVVSLDPSYYNYTLCHCDVGYFGSPPNCSACLNGAECDGVSGRMRIPTGSYPSPSPDSPQFLVKCPAHIVSSDVSNCNPDNSDTFQCKVGTKGRLCAQCDDRYYQKQGRCIACPSVGVSIVIIIVFFAGILIVALILLMLPKPARSSTVLVVKTLILYMQFGNVLITKTGLQWPRPLISLNFAYDLTSVNLAFFSCVMGQSLVDISMETQALSVIVFIFLGLAVLIFLFVFFELLNWIQENAEETKQGAEDDEWEAPDENDNAEVEETDARQFFIRDKSIFETQDEKVKPIKRKFFLVRGAVTVLKFLYLPVTTAILQMFQCEHDPGLNKSFMKFNPARECSMSDQVYGRNYVFSWILIPIFVIGFPAFVVYISVRYEKRDKVARNVWYFLFNDYKEGRAMFLLWSLIRSLILSVICVLIPREADITLTLLVLFMVTTLFINLYVVPYVNSVQNYQEDLAFIALGVTLALGLVNSGIVAAQAELLATIVIAVQVLFAIGLLYSILLHGEALPVTVVRYMPFWRFITDRTEMAGVGASPTLPTSMPGSIYAVSAFADRDETSPAVSPRSKGASIKQLTAWIESGRRLLSRTTHSVLAKRSGEVMAASNDTMFHLEKLSQTLTQAVLLQKGLKQTGSPTSAEMSPDDSCSFSGGFSPPTSPPPQEAFAVDDEVADRAFFVPVRDEGEIRRRSDESRKEGKKGPAEDDCPVLDATQVHPLDESRSPPERNI